MRNLDKYRYEYASHRVEELLPLVTDDMPATHPLAMELAIMSDVVIAYEKKLDFLSARDKCRTYVEMYPTDEAGAKELEFLNTRG